MELKRGPHTVASLSSRTKVLNLKTICRVFRMLALASFVTTASAQEVIIPDAGLNAAVRAALQKPAGPLTETDLLSLTSLSAGGRSISNVAGLEFAHNLSILDRTWTRSFWRATHSRILFCLRV